MPKVEMNISGTYFEFDSKILETRKKHTLTKMCREAESAGKPLKFFVDRPAVCFAAVLAFYQTDELHMPTEMCPKAFRKELQYWGVAETDLEKCCLYRYYAFFNDFESHEKFQKESFVQDISNDTFTTVVVGNRLNRLRRRIWKIIDSKENTKWAKGYHIFVFLMVLLCIFTLALSTVPAFRRKLRKCELLEYLDHSEHEAAEKARIKLGDPDCSDNDLWYEEELEDDDLSWEEEEGYYTDGNWTTTTTYIYLPEKTIPLFLFGVLELIFGVFFTIDLAMRFFTCPSVKRFLFSVLNIFDVLAVVGFYVYIIIINTEKEYKYESGWVRFLSFLQIIRALRLVRFVKHVRASRVLLFSLRQNSRDMALLVLLLMIAVSTSACLVYFIESRENIESIPIGWYWAMITLTTVGYGDVTPKTGYGRVVASILAICGVLLLAITLPMFVNNFLTLYQYSCLDDTIEEHIKSSRDIQGIIHVETAVENIKATKEKDSCNDKT